jgi:hypothetical protein
MQERITPPVAILNSRCLQAWLKSEQPVDCVCSLWLLFAQSLWWQAAYRLINLMTVNFTSLGPPDCTQRTQLLIVLYLLRPTRSRWSWAEQARRYPQS